MQAAVSTMTICLFLFLFYVLCGGLLLPVCMHIFHPNPRELNHELMHFDMNDSVVAFTLSVVDRYLAWLLM